MLTVIDINNLLNVLARTQFQGLEEAEVGVVLKHKLLGMRSELQNPKVAVPEESLDI